MKTEGKKERLSLTSKRWSLLRKRIGKNIINYIQKTNLKNEEKGNPPNLTDEQHIEEILEEASAYGLRYEVEVFAEGLLDEDPTLSRLDAYVMAYHDWIK